MSGPVLAGTIWLGIFAVLVVAEIISVGLTSIWFAISALLSSVVAYFGANIYVQLTVFIVFSILFLLILRPYTMKKINGKTEATNAESFIGKTYVTIADVDNDKDMGQVKVGDVEWTVFSEDGSFIPKGTKVKVTKLEGNKLVVIKA